MSPPRDDSPAHATWQFVGEDQHRADTVEAAFDAAEDVAGMAMEWQEHDNGPSEPMGVRTWWGESDIGPCMVTQVPRWMAAMDGE